MYSLLSLDEAVDVFHNNVKQINAVKDVHNAGNRTSENSKDNNENYAAEIGASVILDVGVSCEECVDKPYEPTKNGDKVKDVKPNIAPRRYRL